MNIIKPARKPSLKLFLAVLFGVTQCVKYVKGSYLIDDYRVRSLDVSPALGRGYSIKTNQFHSICLNVEETTEPSYNYDYTFTDMSGTSSSDTSSSVSSKVKGSFGYSWVKSNMSRRSKMNTTTNSKSQYHTIMTTMRIERYYASVKENKAELSDDAKILLAAKDYVGFYKSCGPNYVRSIRRAQEVTAMFSFTSSDSTSTKKMKSTIEASVSGGWGRIKAGVDRTSKSDSTSRRTEQSLRINIVGYGLGLDKNGSESLVATTLDEFNNVMDFAFSSMTRGNQGSAQTGMVYGIEVVPWSANTAFQVESKVFEAEESVEDAVGLPKYILPFDSIADATCSEVCTCSEANHEIDNEIDNKCCELNDMDITCVEDSVICRELTSTKLCCTNGDNKKSPDQEIETCATDAVECDSDSDDINCCVNDVFKISCAQNIKVASCPKKCCVTDQIVDKFEKCCVKDDMNSDGDVCVPKRDYPLDLLKRNLDSNGELVSEMDFVYRKKLLNIMNLDGCITQLKSLPPSEKYTILEGQDSVKDDTQTADKTMSVRKLLKILDPDDRGTGLKMLNWELEEWMDKFYMPCLNALYGLSAGGTGSSADTYFMTKPWQEHDACRNPTCLIPHYRWDRNNNNGCTPSFGMLGGTDENLTMKGNECGKKQVSGDPAPVCRHTNQEWNDGLESFGKCWIETAPISLMEKYCYPRLSDFSETVEDQKIELCN